MSFFEFKFEEFKFLIVEKEVIYIYKNNFLVYRKEFKKTFEESEYYFFCRNIYLQHTIEEKAFDDIEI